jgi:tetratricopeptide (TPR) repeat protein
MQKTTLLFLILPVLIWAQSNFEKGEQLFHAADYNRAAAHFQSVLNNTPSDLKTIEYLGDIAGHNKEWDKAIAYYQRLKQLRPSEANYYYKFGGVLGMKALEVNKFKALGMIDDVKEAFEKAIILNPKHIESRWALIELYIKLPGIVGGSEIKALKYSNELLKLSVVDGYLSRGHIEEYFKRYNAAELYYKKAMVIGDSKTAHLKLAYLYKHKMNEPDKAKSILEEYKKRNRKG